MAKQIDPSQSQFERVPSGFIFLDGIHVADTVQCCHCGCHWVSVKGSGHVRGFCLVCNKRTCGKDGCNYCVPYERRLEQEEKALRMG